MAAFNSLRSRRFDKDWEMGEQKRTFRAMINRVEGEVVSELKETLRSNYKLDRLLNKL